MAFNGIRISQTLAQNSKKAAFLAAEMARKNLAETGPVVVTAPASAWAVAALATDRGEANQQREAAKQARRLALQAEAKKAEEERSLRKETMKAKWAFIAKRQEEEKAKAEKAEAKAQAKREAEEARQRLRKEKGLTPFSW